MKKPKPSKKRTRKELKEKRARFINEICIAFANGISVEELASQYGRSPVTIEQLIRRRGGVLPPERATVLIQGYKQGFSISHIAQSMLLEEEDVIWNLRAHGIRIKKIK